MTKQRSKEEITGEYCKNTNYTRTGEGFNFVLIEGFRLLIEVLCDIRDNLKEQCSESADNHYRFEKK